MKRQTAIIFYLLGVYVVIQFSWWGFHLIQLTRELGSADAVITKKVLMISGEGLVFFMILLVGLWRIKSAIRKGHQLSERQNNFMLSVTHELKTPLASTKLYLQTLLKRDFTPDKREELLQKALLENQRLEQIVESILTATRLEHRTVHLHKEKIQFHALIRSLVAGFNPQEGPKWVMAEISDEVEIEADVFVLTTILRNLIENALKYAGHEQPVVVFLRKEGQGIRFGTRDLGPGIPKEMWEEVFMKFVRVENEETRSAKGTGLGLFIVAEFTRLSGGSITYIPNKPKGSIFEVTL